MTIREQLWVSRRAHWWMVHNGEARMLHPEWAAVTAEMPRFHGKIRLAKLGDIRRSGLRMELGGLAIGRRLELLLRVTRLQVRPGLPRRTSHRVQKSLG